MKDDIEKKLQLAAGLYLAKLIRCAFDEGTTPGALPEGVTLRRVYALARKNGVEGASSYGAAMGDYPDDGELAGKWKSSADKTLMKQAMFDTEREGILSEMAAEGISYLPLKGIRLSKYYPMPGMRDMGDNDLLYGFVEPDPDGGYRIRPDEDAVAQAQAALVKIMESRGYEVHSLKGNHDAFHKRPFYNFEMHRDIMPDYDSSFEYYRNSWKRAVPDGTGGFGYVFSDEDDYVYNIAHAHTHYVVAGCGIRHLVDMYVVHRAIGDSLDMDYIRGELQVLGILGFHEGMYSLMKSLFMGDGKLTPKEEEMFLFFLGAGTYGSRETQFDIAMEKIDGGGDKSFRTKLVYLKNRIILPQEVCKRAYPFFYGKPYLAPVLTLYRLGKGLVLAPGRLWREIKMILKK